MNIIERFREILHEPAPAWVHTAAFKILEYGCIVAVVAGWIFFHPTEEKAGTVVIATRAKEVKNVPVVDTKITSGTVAVYKGSKALKKKLNLPQPVVDDAKKEVQASSQIKASEHPQTVTTVIDTETGKSETYVRTDPLPWLAYESRGEVGVFYGMKNGEKAIRLQARQDFIQVKALHAGVIASVDRASGRPDTFIGVGVTYRW